MISSHRVPGATHLIAVGAAMAFTFTACGGSNSDAGGSGGSGGGASAASWCEFTEESDLVDEIFDTLGENPAEIETGLKQVEVLVQRLPGEAPAEIADDAKVLADGTQMLIDAFAAADYELLDADLSFMSDTELEARLDEAGENIDVYTERECGRSFGESSTSDDGEAPDDSSSSDDSEADDSDFDPSNGTLREQLITQFESIGLEPDEAACIADNLDFADPAVQSGDIGAMLSVFEDCEISLERLAEIGG